MAPVDVDIAEGEANSGRSASGPSRDILSVISFAIRAKEECNWRLTF